jgi:ribose 5-phosphate isomerase A
VVTIDVQALKRLAAHQAVEEIRDGMVLGLGSGSTAEQFIAELGTRVGRGRRVLGVPTSERSAALARSHGVPLTTLDEHPRVDLTVDGADEIDPSTLTLIKGGGGSLVREKLVAAVSERVLIIADESKLVGRLGEHHPVPVAVLPFGWHAAVERITALGASVTRRQAAGETTPFVTNDGLHVLDCQFGPISDPARLASEIKAQLGVVEHGLFIGLADRALIASEAGVRVLEPLAPRR